MADREHGAFGPTRFSRGRMFIHGGGAKRSVRRFDRIVILSDFEQAAPRRPPSHDKIGRRLCATVSLR